MKTLCFALLFVLVACSSSVLRPTSQGIGTETNTHSPSAALSPSPVSVPTTQPTGTPVPRWVEYQSALASRLFPNETGVLCEWDLLGRRGRQVYLWVVCFNEWRNGAVPAVVQLGADGQIEKVTLPRDGSYYSDDIRILFPPEVQQELSTDSFSSKMEPGRLKDPSLPPFSVASGTPLP